MPDPSCDVCFKWKASKHYGVMTCESCKCFFRRSIDKRHNFLKGYNHSAKQRQRYHRMRRCFVVGMNLFGIHSKRQQGGRHGISKVTYPLGILPELLRGNYPSSEEDMMKRFAHLNQNGDENDGETEEEKEEIREEEKEEIREEEKEEI